MQPHEEPGSSSIGFLRQEYWSGLPFPSPKDLLTQTFNLGPLHDRFFTDQTKRKADIVSKYHSFRMIERNIYSSDILTKGLPDARAQVSEPWIFCMEGHEYSTWPIRSILKEQKRWDSFGSLITYYDWFNSATKAPLLWTLSSKPIAEDKAFSTIARKRTSLKMS